MEFVEIQAACDKLAEDVNRHNMTAAPGKGAVSGDQLLNIMKFVMNHYLESPETEDPFSKLTGEYGSYLESEEAGGPF